MNDERTDTRREVETLLQVSGIPVPDDEIEKLVEMYRGGASARAALRAPELGESEPVIAFTPSAEVGDV